MKKITTLLIIIALLMPSMAMAGGGKEKAVNQVEVLHWWTSGGEAAALNVLKEDLESKGISWVDMPVAGGGGEQAMTVLRSRVTAGDAPTAVQMLGFDILDWAEQGMLADLNEIADEGDWDQVIPKALQRFSKYDGKWIAAPVNVHSTNWVWANLSIMEELGLDIPKTWDEFVAALEAAQNAGYIGLAHGGQAWQDATLFDGVVLSVGGPEFYKKALVDLDPATLMSDQMREAFRRMSVLRSFVDDDFSGRDWNLATAKVINGEALFQMMGDWAKGEFFNAGKKDGVDFTAFRTPGTQGSVTFNADQFAMFAVGEARQASQKELAKSILSPEFQIAFNLVKGSVPARTDVSDAEFTPIGKKAMKDLAEANKNGTLLGSMAHGHGAPAAVKNAVYDVVTAHFNQQINDEEAVEQLAKAIADAQN